MAKTKISEFSTTAGNNTDINSINIAEGCAPSGINDAIRELMRQLKEFQTGGAGDSVNSGGDFSVATNKFTVASATGNTAVAGTLGATGNFAINTDKFTVTASSGNTAVAGTLASTGNFAVNTDKFTVAASSGNTAVAGTFAVTGATTLTGALVANGNSTLGDADTDTVTLNASFVTGTTLKTAKSDTNTLALAAYDVDGTAYTNLVTLTAGNTPSLALTSTAVGTINNMSIGATTASTGAFTTLSASGNVTLSDGTANGVLYLNGSKVATSGSALVFDGSNLGVGVTPNTTIWSGDETRLVVKGTGSSYAGTFAVQSKGTNNAVTGYFIANDIVNTVVLGSRTNTPVVFNTNDTEAMRLTSTGLGIGTSSPAYKLDVNGAINIYSGQFFRSGSNPLIASNGSTFNYHYAGTTALAWRNQADNAEFMRLDSSGNLLVGTTINPVGQGAKITAVNTGTNYAGTFVSDNKDYQTILVWNKATTGTRYLMEFGTNASYAAKGSITTDGTNTAYNTSSDYRLKNITGPISNSGAYIDSLKPVEGTWKENGSVFVGLIAHEVQEVSRTSIVTGEKDGEKMQSMDYSSAEIIANLIAEVKSLRARVAALES